jgi:uncharacterized membrane protein
MESDGKIRSLYYNYIKKSRKQKAHSLHTNWGYWFFLVGTGLGIFFIAFAMDYGFGNILLSAIGIFSLILVIAGLIILIKSNYTRT